MKTDERERGLQGSRDYEVYTIILGKCDIYLREIKTGGALSTGQCAPAPMIGANVFFVLANNKFLLYQGSTDFCAQPPFPTWFC